MAQPRGGGFVRLARGGGGGGRGAGAGAGAARGGGGRGGGGRGAGGGAGRGRGEGGRGGNAARNKEQLMAEYRPRIQDVLGRTGGVLMVTGMTGSGKSTLIPQIFLDLVGQDKDIFVVVPRRIPAIMLYNRLRRELGDRADLVGYQLGGHVKVGTEVTRLWFITAGLLAKQIASNTEYFFRCGAVIVDEVHERGRETEVVMSQVKTLRQNVPAGRRIPNIVIMSATFNPHLFVNYFRGAVALPVEDFVLDMGNGLNANLDVLELYTNDLQVEGDNAANYIEELMSVFANPWFEKAMIPIIFNTLIRIDQANEFAPYRDGNVLVFVPGVREIDESFPNMKLIFLI